MRALKQLKANGFTAASVGDALKISPANQITDVMRQWIAANRSRLLAQLKATPDKTIRAQWHHKGLSLSQASRLADVIAERNYSLDSRRSCVECSQFLLLRERMRCKAGRAPLGQADIYTLHQCGGFTESAAAAS